jgi:hypothetical protein
MGLKADATVEASEVRALVGRVLDGMAITEMVYHGHAHTRPLVEDLLFRLMNHVDAGTPARVLLVGGNSLLAETIAAAGYDLHHWRFGENVFTDDVEARLRGRLTPPMFGAGCLPLGEERFDALVLPLVFEHVPEGPAAVLRALAPFLKRDGVIVGATQNLGGFSARLRVLRGKPFMPEAHEAGTRVSFDLPLLPARRYYLPAEVEAAARAAGLHPRDWAYSVGRTPFSLADWLWVKDYVKVKVRQALMQAVPSLRGYIVFTLGRATAEDRRCDDVPAGSARALRLVL